MKPDFIDNVSEEDIKIGGENYFINFLKEGIFKKGQVFLIIGLNIPII